jgi:hypothetical protein
MKMKELGPMRGAGQLSAQDPKNDSKEPATVIFGNS